MSFYARWAALGAFTVFWTVITLMIFDADVIAGIGGLTVGALITARVFVGPAPARKDYPSTVRGRRQG